MPNETEKVKRKLRAILSADVKGYSLLMANDEAFTIKTLKAYRNIMSDLIKQYSGRVVDSPGDNVLAEFSSVVDAVTCATEVQKVLKVKNEELPDEKRLEFRIGVNIGDVVQDGDRIYGNGVNVAARIEGLAEPGGVSISRNAYGQIKDKLPFGYEYIGEHEVKNIKDPIRVYKVLMDPADSGKLVGDEPRRPRKKWMWPVVVVAAIVITSIAWQVYQKMSTPEFEPASVDNMAYPLPEKPSIAVLPFNNLSGDTTQDYIADGISENIISALSNISEMFVIASSSTFAYKGKPVKVQQVSEELGVQYVLEGSAQKAGNRVRVTAQLIDATTGHHLWSEKYDRDMQDLFILQDELAHKIIVELQVKLTEGEQARVSHKSTTNLEAWSYAVKGLKLFEHSSKENNAKAMELFERAVELDPGYVWAWVRLAWTHVMAAKPGWSPSPSEHSKKVDEISKKVLSLDESDSDVLALLGLYYLRQGQFEKAITEGEKSIVLGPTNAQAHVLLAVSMNAVGRFDDVIRLVKIAMRLHPYYPAYYLQWLGVAYRMTGRYDEALTVYNQLFNRSRNGEYRVVGAHLFLAELYAEIGKEDVARTHATEILKMEPGFSLEGISKISTYFYKDPAHLERRLKALRKAGIPETPPLPLPDKPSIAVLAFDNLSGDPEQEYFNDGITEEIISSLSKTDQLFVIARNSSFVYKGKPVNVKQISRELGVRYVLEGSVRKSEDRVRITAQLIDATKGHHLWSERYDRDLKDIFALQDEITKKIVTALNIKLTHGDLAAVYSKGTDNLEAYLNVLQGLQYIRRGNFENLALAKKMAKEAISLDSNYAAAYYLQSWCNWVDMYSAGPAAPKLSLNLSIENAQKAITLDNSFAEAHALLGWLYTLARQHERGVAEAEAALALNPSSAAVHAWLGMTLNYAGKHEEAIKFIRKRLQYNPTPLPDVLAILCVAYRDSGCYEEGISAAKKAVHLEPDQLIGHSCLASCYALLGKDVEAKAESAEVLRIAPVYSLSYLNKVLPYKDPADTKLVIDSLRKAGLPD